MAKSMASALVGIALDRGEIDSLEVPLSDYFPDWENAKIDNITLRHLLEMRSGLDWNENEQAPVMALESQDHLAYALNRPVAYDPGQRFNYSSGDSMLLAQVIQQATGEDLADYAENHLWQPIGVNADWWKDGEGNYLTYCCVDATARDYAKFGQLFLDLGKTGDQQVISESWVQESTNAAPDLDRYGLHWWTNKNESQVIGAPENMFVAAGLHEQFIFVFPDQNLVVVRNSTYRRTSEEAVAELGVGIETQGDPNWDSASLILPILKSVGYTP